MKTAHLLITASLCLAAISSISAQSTTDAARAIDVEKFAKAESIAKAVIKQNPANADAYYYWGLVALEAGKTDSAKIIFNKGIAANKEGAINYVGLAGAQMDQDNIGDAFKSLETAFKIAGPKDVNILVKAAEAYINYNSKNTAKAIQYLNQAAGIESRNPLIYLTIGDAYLADNNGSQAVTNYEKATELDKTYAKAYMRIGELYLRARSAGESEKSLNKAIEVDPTYAPAYSALAELQYQKKQYKEATETFKKYLSMVDNTNATKIKYAKFLFLSKDYPKTIEVINEVFKTDSSNVIMKRLLSYSLYEQKQYAEGLKYMNKFFSSVDKKKILTDDYIYYGRLLFQNGQDSVSILNFKKVLELDNSRTEVYSDIAEADYHAKNYHDAAIWLSNKINAKKGSVKDQFRLGQAYYYDKDYKNADSVFAKVAEAQVNYYPAYQWRGRSASQLEEANPQQYSAKPYYEKVVELAATDVAKNKKDLIEAYNYLSVYYIKKDDNVNAKSFLNKILELDPENKDAKEYLKRLK